MAKPKRNVKKILEMIESGIAEIAEELEGFPETSTQDDYIFSKMVESLNYTVQLSGALHDAAFTVREKGLADG